MVCKYYFEGKCRCMDSCLNQDFYKEPLCEEITDCYYKQLAEEKELTKILREELDEVQKLDPTQAPYILMYRKLKHELHLLEYKLSN